MIPWFGVRSKADLSSKLVSPAIQKGTFSTCKYIDLVDDRFNEEMIETLFGYAPTGKNKLPTKKDAAQEAPKFIQIIDAKKAQNLSILLKALNVTTEEVRDALEEGNFASLVSDSELNGRDDIANDSP